MKIRYLKRQYTKKNKKEEKKTILGDKFEEGPVREAGEVENPFLGGLTWVKGKVCKGKFFFG